MADQEESRDLSLVWVTLGTIAFGAIIIYILSQVAGA